MNQDVELNVININDRDYFLMDTLVGKSTYYYFSNIKDASDIIVLKDKGDDFVSLDSDIETDYALSLFYEKHKENV